MGGEKALGIVILSNRNICNEADDCQRKDKPLTTHTGFFFFKRATANLNSRSRSVKEFQSYRPRLVK